MGSLIATEFVTLDGVAQAPGTPDEDPSGGFTHGGWQQPLFAEDEYGQQMVDEARHMDALLLGRRTYEIFAGYWPTAPDEIPFTELLNRVPKYVATRTLADPLDWNASTCLTGDLAEAVGEIKARHEEVHLIGSLDLLQSLLRLGLVDRLQLWLYPLVLGAGKRVFEPGTAASKLRLVDSVAFPSGALRLEYEPAGAPGHGDFTA